MFTDPQLESAARNAIATDEPEKLLALFATLTRESGTPDEHAAGEYIAARLRALGVPVTVHRPELFLSIPERSELTVNGEAIRCRGRPLSRSRPAAPTSPARSATCRRSTPAARRSLRHAVGRLGRARRRSGRRPHRRHRGVLDARHRARLRAARRHRADLHSPRRGHPRRHLHADLGRADPRDDRAQAEDAGRLRQQARRRAG